MPGLKSSSVEAPRQKALLQNLSGLQKYFIDECKRGRFPSKESVVLVDKQDGEAYKRDSGFLFGTTNRFTIGNSNFPELLNDSLIEISMFMFEKKSVFILKSSKNYKEAHSFALKAAKDLGIKLDLMGLEENSEIGLSSKPDDCESQGFSFPCYVARGRAESDEGKFISVEYSTGFQGFAPKYYIVVAGVWPVGKSVSSEELKQIKVKVPDAYVKNTLVYQGCIH